MRAIFATLAFAAVAAAVPQAVTSAIAPSSSPPPGCSENYNGHFIITPVDTNSTSLEERNTPLTITLKNGILTDSDGRTGYVASNQQFQFDGPPQAGAIYTAGFSICPNGRLAIGNDETWYKCLSGSFFNLYLHNDAGQCSEIWLQVTGVNGGTPAPASGTTAATMTTMTVSPGVNASAPIATMPTASGSMNGTASMSTAGNVTMTRTTASLSMSGAGKTTSGTQLMTGGPTSAQSAASAATASSASSSSSAGDAVALPTARGDVLGLAAGLLAMAML